MCDDIDTLSAKLKGIYKVQSIPESVAQAMSTEVRVDSLFAGIPNRGVKIILKTGTEILNYFRSMVDTVAEHEAFQARRQTKGETIVTFHAKLTQKMPLCRYNPKLTLKN